MDYLTGGGAHNGVIAMVPNNQVFSVSAQIAANQTRVCFATLTHCQKDNVMLALASWSHGASWVLQTSLTKSHS